MAMSNPTHILAKPPYWIPRIVRRLYIGVALLAATSTASTIFCMQSDARSATTALMVRPPVSLTSDDQYDQLGMGKIAEMAAFARHNEECSAIPREWSTAFIILLLANPPSEPQVALEEKKLLALRRKIGRHKWCALYRIEMNEAYLVYLSVTRE